MSEPRRAALLLSHRRPVTLADKDTAEAQYLACRLYAANHDMVIVGLCDVGGDQGGREQLPGGPGLAFVPPGDVAVVLAVAPVANDESSAWLVGALERLREARVEVVLIDGRDW